MWTLPQWHIASRLVAFSGRLTNAANRKAIARDEDQIVNVGLGVSAK